MAKLICDECNSSFEFYTDHCWRCGALSLTREDVDEEKTPKEAADVGNDDTDAEDDDVDDDATPDDEAERVFIDGVLEAQAQPCVKVLREDGRREVLEALLGYFKDNGATRADGQYICTWLLARVKKLTEETTEKALHNVFERANRSTGSWEALLRAYIPLDVMPIQFGSTYVYRGQFTYRLDTSDEKPRMLPVCNFRVKVVRDIEVYRDSGIERHFDLDVKTVAGDVVSMRVSSDDLGEREISKTFARYLGSRAMITPKEGPHVLLSAFSKSNPIRRRDVAATGWYTVRGKRVFVMPDRVFATEDTPDLMTLYYDPQIYSDFIGQYRVPAKPDPKRLKKSLRYLIEGTLQTAPMPQAFYLLYSHVLASPMLPMLQTRSRTVLYLFGRSGGYKSTTAQQAQRIFGPFNLQAVQSFASTVNALEPALALPRHLPSLADDLKEGGVIQHQVVRMIQAYSGGQGRGRYDMRTRDQAPGAVIRSNLIITAENTLEGQASTEARTVGVRVDRGEIPKEYCEQIDTYASVMPEIGSWLINRLVTHYDDLQKEVEKAFKELRSVYGDLVTVGGHMRVPESMALVTIGLYLVSYWLVEDGLIPALEAAQLRESLFLHASEAVRAQLESVEEQDAAAIFLEVLQDAYLTSDTLWLNFVPPNAHGDLLGFSDQTGSHVWICAGLAFRVVQETLRRSNRELAFRPRDVWLGLYERGLTESPRPIAYKHVRCVKFKPNVFKRKLGITATGIPKTGGPDQDDEDSFNDPKLKKN